MKVIAIAHRSDKHSPEDFAPHLEAESNHALKLFAEETVRELYSRADGNGAVLILEAENEEKAKEILDGLPLARVGMLTFEIFSVRPYRGFIANVT